MRLGDPPRWLAVFGQSLTTLGAVLTVAGILAAALNKGEAVGELTKMDAGSVGSSSGDGVGGLSPGVPTSCTIGIVLLRRHER